jgi:predicted Zn-dependent peptidase
MEPYAKKILSNKLSYITVPLKGTQTVTVLLVVKTGSKYESRQESGLSHFLEHMFFKGTAKRPTALSLSSELDSIGAEYNAGINENGSV